MKQLAAVAAVAAVISSGATAAINAISEADSGLSDLKSTIHRIDKNTRSSGCQLPQDRP